MYKMKQHADLMFVQTADELHGEKTKNEQAQQLLDEQDDEIAERREGFLRQEQLLDEYEQYKYTNDQMMARLRELGESQFIDSIMGEANQQPMIVPSRGQLNQDDTESLDTVRDIQTREMPRFQM